MELIIPEGFPSGPLGLYYGLSGFYSAYMGLKSSFSSIQLQAPRSAANLPYSACSPVQKLSDLRDVANPYLPIDAFTQDPNWRDRFNLTEVANMTLRPCGALYYWALTDKFALFDGSGGGPHPYGNGVTWDTLEIPAEPRPFDLPYIDSTTGEFVWIDPAHERFRAWSRANIGSDILIKDSDFPDGLAPGRYTVKVYSCRDMGAEKFVRICSTTWVGTNQVFLSAIFFACGSIIVAATIIFIFMSYRRPL